MQISVNKKNRLHGAESLRRLIRKLPAFIEFEGSLPRSKQPSTGQYSEIDESSPHPPMLLASLTENKNSEKFTIQRE
jgi:hypothetical protein